MPPNIFLVLLIIVPPILSLILPFSLPPFLPPHSAGLLKVTNTTLSPCFGNPEVFAMNGNLKDIGNAFGVVDHTVSRIRRRMLLTNHDTHEHNTTQQQPSLL